MSVLRTVETAVGSEAMVSEAVCLRNVVVLIVSGHGQDIWSGKLAHLTLPCRFYPYSHILVENVKVSAGL